MIKFNTRVTCLFKCLKAHWHIYGCLTNFHRQNPSILIGIHDILYLEQKISLKISLICPNLTICNSINDACLNTFGHKQNSAADE